MVPIIVTFDLDGTPMAEVFDSANEALLFAIHATSDPDGPEVALVHGDEIVEVRNGEILDAS